METVGEYSWRTILVLSIMCAGLPVYGYRISSACIDKTSFVTVNLICEERTVIHVVEVLGGNHTDDSCTVDKTMCHEVIGPNWMHFTLSNGKMQCDHEVGYYQFRKCKVTAAQVKYDCVETSTVIDMCSGVSQGKRESNSVIYLKSPGFPYSNASNKECKCIVKTEGSFMKFKLLDLRFSYNKNYTKSPRFTIRDVNTTLWDAEEQTTKSCPSLSCGNFNQHNLNIAQTQSYIQVFYNNRKQYNQNLWIEITGQLNKLMTLECHANISSDNRITTTQIATQSILSSTETTSLQLKTTSSSTETSLQTKTSSASQKPASNIPIIETTLSTVTTPTTAAVATTAAAGSSSASTKIKQNETGYKNSTIVLAVVAGVLFILLITVAGMFLWYVRRHRMKPVSTDQGVSDVITEENRELTNQNDGVYEIPDEQNTRVQADHAEAEIRQETRSNHSTGLVEEVDGLQHNQNTVAQLGQQMGDQGRFEEGRYLNLSGFEEEMGVLQRNTDGFGVGGYINSGQDVRLSEYETLDPSARLQNTYEKLTPV